MKQRYIVPRFSNDEFTFAVVTAKVERGLSAAAFRDMLTGALTEWVATTDEGERQWQASSRNRNVGDLSECLPARGALSRILAEHGIRGLAIETFVDCASPAIGCASSYRELAPHLQRAHAGRTPGACRRRLTARLIRGGVIEELIVSVWRMRYCVLRT